MSEFTIGVLDGFEEDYYRICMMANFSDFDMNSADILLVVSVLIDVSTSFPL